MNIKFYFQAIFKALLLNFNFFSICLISSDAISFWLTDSIPSKPGEELTFEAWQPSSRLPLLPGPQGHQPVPSKGDLIKVYLLYNADTKTHHPYMPNGIQILRKENSKK